MLVDLFQRKALPRVFVLDKVDGSVGSVRNELHHLEVLLAWGLALEVLTGHRARARGVLAIRPSRRTNLQVSYL